MTSPVTIGTIPARSRVGIDANVLVYHFSGGSPQCTGLLLRCEQSDLEGYVPQPVLAEALHRLMILEALGKGLIRGSNPARKLREHPEVIRGLSDYAAAARAISVMGLRLLFPTEHILEASQKIRDRYGLLVNDSLTVAALQAQSISILVTADRDFERVKDLTVCRPTDLAASSST